MEEILSDGRTAWLEPGAGEMAEAKTSIPSDQAIIAAQISAAITFKRLVDMLEPLAQYAAQEIAKERKEGKRK